MLIWHQRVAPFLNLMYELIDEIQVEIAGLDMIKIQLIPVVSCKS